MSVINPLEQKNLLHVAPSEVRKAVTKISEGLCIKYNIDKTGDELVVFIGFLSDKNNLEAISAWVYQMMQEIEVSSIKELLTQLETYFENRLTQLSSTRAYG